ncbi:MAG: hypothetical protein JWP69_2314 [Flaviaesturariibacter sp.]|nr:hypothetical protein [Flaviaesturariibacter sp.]
MWRAGFGPAASQLNQLTAITPTELYKALQKGSSKRPTYIDVADNYLKGLYMGAEEIGRQGKKNELDAEERKRIRNKNRDSIKSLNLTWLYQMIGSEQQLREKMAFFWHGHFASRNVNIFFQQQLLDVVRENALGSFRDLLHGVSKSAAMLNFLNAQQNKKDHPNENFAREVMELFTLGRGNYTENDIKEAARAFTGWSATPRGEFAFRRFQHDTGSKTVLGKTGNFEGEDVLDILLEQKATARFITQKVYRAFVNDVVDNSKIDWLSERFYKSEYNIGKLMEDIFTSDWFYDPKNIGAKIKSPIELIAGMQRTLPMQLENEEALLLVQRLLGQLLFYPPNVAGWPGGKSWIDSSTLMVRMRLPKMINDQDDFNIRPKTDDDMMGGLTEGGEPNVDKQKGGYGKAARPINAKIEWTPFVKSFEGVPRENLLVGLAGTLLQVPLKVPMTVIKGTADSTSRESFIRSVTLQLMSVPEYQLC